MQSVRIGDEHSDLCKELGIPHAHAGKHIGSIAVWNIYMWLNDLPLSVDHSTPYLAIATQMTKCLNTSYLFTPRLRRPPE